MTARVRLALLPLACWLLAAAGCNPVWRSPITVRVPVETQAAFSGRMPAYVLARALVTPEDPAEAPLTVRMGALCAPSAVEMTTGFVHEAEDCATETEVVAWLQPAPDEDRAALTCGIYADPSSYETGAIPTDVPQGRARAFIGLGPCASQDGTPAEIVVRPP